MFIIIKKLSSPKHLEVLWKVDSLGWSCGRFNWMPLWTADKYIKEFTTQRQAYSKWTIINTCFCFEGEPEIDASGTGSVAKVGEMITLNCSALGYPSPQFNWNPSGKQVRLCAPNRFGLNLIFTSEKTVFIVLCNVIHLSVCLCSQWQWWGIGWSARSLLRSQLRFWRTVWCVKHTISMEETAGTSRSNQVSASFSYKLRQC